MSTRIEMDVSRHAIEELHEAQRDAARRARNYVLAALPPVGLLLVHVIGPAAAALAIACAITGALWWGASRSRARDTERRLADELILRGWRTVAPDSFDWRVSELASARVRRALARAIERQTELPLTPVPIVRIAADVRQNRERLARLASRLRDERPVDPRGLVLVSRLIADVEGSALYRASDAPKLERQLDQVEQLIDAA